MNKSDIESLLEVGERISLECKKSEKGLPKSFWETYSSFANTIGGIVLLGVKEDVTAGVTHYNSISKISSGVIRESFFLSRSVDVAFSLSLSR